MTDRFLDMTHRWGEHVVREQGEDTVVPFCLDCRVEGYENEPAAFTPCPGGVASVGCGATMESREVPGHTHRCSYSHDHHRDTQWGDHHCRECLRWFG